MNVWTIYEVESDAIEFYSSPDGHSEYLFRDSSVVRPSRVVEKIAGVWDDVDTARCEADGCIRPIGWTLGGDDDRDMAFWTFYVVDDGENVRAVCEDDALPLVG